MIDSHMHINSKICKQVCRDICRITYNFDLRNAINIGLDLETSKEITVISKRNPKIYCTVGVHPLYVDNQSLDDIETLYSMVTNKVVAIGEIGLDTSKPNLEKQRLYFIKQIHIANTLGLPIVIHSNNSNQEIIKIFETIIKPEYGCVFHCYQPDLNILKYIIKHGYYISFAGKITYSNANKSLQVAKTIPDDLYLIETDSPYIPPEPLRNEINDSRNLVYIIDKLSEVMDKPKEQIIEESTNNTLRLFKKMQ